MGVRRAIVYARSDGAESYPIPTPVVQVLGGYYLFRKQQTILAQSR